MSTSVLINYRFDPCVRSYLSANSQYTCRHVVPRTIAAYRRFTPRSTVGRLIFTNEVMPPLVFSREDLLVRSSPVPFPAHDVSRCNPRRSAGIPCRRMIFARFTCRSYVSAFNVITRDLREVGSRQNYAERRIFGGIGTEYFSACRRSSAVRR